MDRISRVILIVLGLTVPSMVGVSPAFALPGELEPAPLADGARDAANATTAGALAGAPGTLHYAGEIPTNESMNTTAMLLGSLNATFTSINTLLETLGPEATFNATRAAAIGQLKILFETANGTSRQLLYEAGAFAVVDAINGTNPVLGQAFITLETVNATVGLLPYTARGTVNASYANLAKTAGDNRPTPGLVVNSTRDQQLLPVVLSIVSNVETARVAFFALADSVEPTPEALAAAVVAASDTAFDTVAGLKNATANSTAVNTTTQTPFGAAYTAVSTAMGLFERINQTIATAQTLNGTARQTAFNTAFLAQEAINRTALDAALNAIEAEADGPLHGARDSAFSQLTNNLITLNTTLNGLVSTLSGQRDTAASTANNTANATVGTGSDRMNATRDDATGAKLDALLGLANATRLQVADAITALAAQLGPQLLDSVPSVPQTLYDLNVPVLGINWPRTVNGFGSHNRTGPLFVNFSTSIPMPAGGPGFVATYALPGTGTWIYMNKTECVGNAQRTCNINWTNASIGANVMIRVGIANETTCATAQCAHVSNVTLDNVAPTTALNATTQIPPFVRSSEPVMLGFTTDPYATVTVRATRSGTAFTLGTAVADGAGNASFAFLAPGNVAGTYLVFANATDRAGNVEVASTTPLATIHAIDSIAIDVADASLYWQNGDTPHVEACLRLGSQDLVDSVGVFVNVSVDGGGAIPMAFETGCTWSGDLPAVAGVTAWQKHALRVEAVLTGEDAEDALTGEFDGELTYSEFPLVALAIDTAGVYGDHRARVPVANDASFYVTAVYPKTGEPADLVEIRATGAGDPIDGIAFGGAAYFSFASPGSVVSIPLTFNATREIALDTDVTGIAATETAIWTRLQAAMIATEHASNNSDVGRTFNATYRVTWAHSNGPVEGASVDLTDMADLNDNVPSGGATAAGDAVVEIKNNSVVEKHYSVTTFYDDGMSTYTDATSLVLDVNFTRIVATISSNDSLANVGFEYPFRVEATFEHDGAPIAGANFTLLENDATPLADVRTNATGVGYGLVTFDDTFNDNVSVRLNGSMGGVTLQKSPISNITVVSTQLSIAPLTVADRDVHPGQTITVGVSVTYAHNGSAWVNGTLTFTDPSAATQTCALANGTASCALSSSGVTSHTLTLTALTDTGIHVIQNGNPVTPTLNWTQLSVARGEIADRLVDVGATVRIPVNVTYAHNASKKAVATVIEAHNGTTLLGSCTTDANGACGLDVSSAAVLSGKVTLTAASNPLGITQLASEVETPIITWTKLLVSYEHDTGPFNTTKGANYRVTVIYAHNNVAVPGALVTLANFSTGSQSNSTNATGFTRISGIESAAGSRNITLWARLPSEGINANQTSGAATVEHRWTAIAFRAYTYNPAPTQFNSTDGGPIYPTNTAVTVCTVVESADTHEPIAGATITMRGVTRTSGADGSACITIAASSQVRNVSVTSHGVSATIGGKVITSSQDRRVTLHFTNG